MEYTKSIDGQLIETSVVERRYDINELLTQIGMWELHRASAQSEIDKLQQLVSKFKQLDVSK